jgi:catechol 2,3-dioxygenase-like lactoylglutathione lyase family enzyme
MKIKLTSVHVDDQDMALRFYTEVLGFAERHLRQPHPAHPVGKLLRATVIMAASMYLAAPDPVPGQWSSRPSQARHRAPPYRPLASHRQRQIPAGAPASDEV